MRMKMLLRLALFCYWFTVINAKPAYETLLDDVEHTKVIQTLDGAIDKILFLLFQHSTVIQHLAVTRSLETRQSLASLPNDCSVEGSIRIEAEEKALLANYYECSIFQILKDLGSIGIDTARYMYDSYKDTTLIVADIVACTTAGVNPFTFVFCIVKAISAIPVDIKDLIDLLEAYKDSLETLVPKVYHEIEACHNKTSSQYETLLNNVIENVKMCENRSKL